MRPKREKLIESIRCKFHSRQIRIFRIKCEQNFIILDVSDLAIAMCLLVEKLGIKKRLCCKQTHNELTNVVNMIRSVGQESILPNKNFLIKVELYAGGLESLGYKEKDIEFAGSGQMAG